MFSSAHIYSAGRHLAMYHGEEWVCNLLVYLDDSITFGPCKFSLVSEEFGGHNLHMQANRHSP